MRQANSTQLFEYWNRVRGGRVAPRRDEIEPSDIRNLLSDTFILEVSGTLRTISYRLAGTRICAAFGRELKGYGFLGHWAEEDCFEIAKLLARVYRDFQPLMIVMRGETASGKTVDYEYVFVPLEPMQDGTARILGIATPMKSFYWLGAEPLINCRLRSMRHLKESSFENSIGSAPSLAPSLVPADEMPGGETTEAPFAGGAGEGSRKIAHLVVHDGGRK